MTSVYPSTEQLIPEVMKAKLPMSLVEEITERYETLGTKYLSEEEFDGRPVNQMMFTDRIINCREEVVDAVFCMLGQIFKEQSNGSEEIDDNIYFILEGLTNIYSALMFMQFNQSYVVSVRPM